MVGVWNKNAKQENSLEFQHPKSSEFQYFSKISSELFPDISAHMESIYQTTGKWKKG